MDNTYNKNYEIVLEDKVVSVKENVAIAGAFILIMAAFGIFTFYGVSLGYYPPVVSLF